MDLVFRLANPTDIPILAQIISSYEAWTRYDIDYKRAVTLIEKMEDTIYIVELDNQVLGFITLRLNGVGNFGAYVRMLAVAEPYQRQGVGRKLVDYAGTIAGPHQPNLFLICSTDNLSAQRFYENAGFESVGLLKNLVIPDHDEILYRKSFGTLY